MNLVKWFRKNNKKVMAVVVIFIMIAFTIGPALRLLRGGGGGRHQTIAYFGDNEKITNYDLYGAAPRELEILKLLGVDYMLRSVGMPLFRTLDMRALLLSELLFPERRISPTLRMDVRRAVRTQGYRITEEQLNNIYRRPMGSEIYWILLKKEAHLAGMGVSNKSAGAQLAKAIQQLGNAIPQFRGATYQRVVRAIIERRRIPEQEILTTFGQLLAVLEYAKVVCTNESLTNSQVMHNASFEGEKIDAEFVKFDSSVFAKAQEEPNDSEAMAHFKKYKKNLAGVASDENIYGFGYKLADRVQLEYIAIKLDDVREIITPPTQEEAEEYYEKNRAIFTEEVPLDPNDPDSPLTEQVRRYADVASDILKMLLQNKINSKAESLLQEAKALTDISFEQTDISEPNLTVEQLKQMAGNYETAARQLTENNKIKVYAGQTGLLNAADIRADEHLSVLFVRGYGRDNPVALSQIVFAIDELDVSELGPFDVPKPRIYENIGPMRDYFGRIMAIARVIKAEKASEPESIDQTFSKSTLRLNETPEQSEENIHSVKDKVVEDLKRLAAMKTTKNKAGEFLELATKDGWDAALEKLNDTYADLVDPNESDPNLFRLEWLTDQPRVSRMGLETLAIHNAGNPAEGFLINDYKKQRRLIGRLYSLVPADSNTVDNLPILMESKPDLSYYCLKQISVKRVEQTEFERMKAIHVYREDHIQSQSMAAVHFSPENILKRLNFSWRFKQPQASDANIPPTVDSNKEDAS